jgi:hypothetical protein
MAIVAAALLSEEAYPCAEPVMAQGDNRNREVEHQVEVVPPGMVAK